MRSESFHLRIGVTLPWHLNPACSVSRYLSGLISCTLLAALTTLLMHPPQGFWTCLSLCLEFSFPRYLLAHSRDFLIKRHPSESPSLPAQFIISISKRFLFLTLLILSSHCIPAFYYIFLYLFVVCLLLWNGNPGTLSKLNLKNKTKHYLYPQHLELPWAGGSIWWTNEGMNAAWQQGRSTCLCGKRINLQSPVSGVSGSNPLPRM